MPKYETKYKKVNGKTSKAEERVDGSVQPPAKNQTNPNGYNQGYTSTSKEGENGK